MAVRFKNMLGYYQTSGNINNAGGITIQDLVYLVNFLFNSGSAPVVPQSADVNCSGTTTVTDLTYLVNFLFNGGPYPCGFWTYY